MFTSDRSTSQKPAQVLLKSTASGKQVMDVHRPWYRCGGMHVNMVCMAVNIIGPVVILALDLSEEHTKSFCILLLCNYLASVITSRTVYCIFVVPTFMASLLLCVSLHNMKPEAALTIALILGIFKVNICMSVCLHRYAAHAAFKCGPAMNMFISVLGCLANQGGPIWWASQHRCHHKYCDVERDPHSPLLSGTEAAFGFFQTHEAIEEEFVPKHLESVPMRVLDTWSWLTVFCEMALSYFIFGREGLFISYTSGWLSQSVTLWFNIVNHPPNRDTKGKCKATNANLEMHELYLPFFFLNALIPIFAFFVMEAEHEHHHNHARLAKRSCYDVAYWGFVWPMEKMGLVWNVVV